MFKNTVYSILLVALVATCISNDATAQSTAPSAKIESIVVPITAAATKFQRAIGDGLGQKLEELRAVIKEGGARVHAALDAAQREGTDAANAKYEDVVSSELQRVQQALQAVTAERRGVLGAQRELSGQLDRVRDTLLQRQATLARQVKEQESTATRLNEQLAALAEKNRSKVESNEPLTAEDDLQARLLAQQAALAEQQRTLGARAAQDAESRLTKLRGFEGQLGTAGGEYGLLFDRAAGQVRLIGQLADMRREGVEVGIVITELNKVGSQLLAVTNALDDANGIIDDLIRAPILGDQTAVVAQQTAPARTTGRDILARILGLGQGGRR